MDQPEETHEQKGINMSPSIQMYQDIVDRAHKEVEFVRKAYIWLGSLITIIISVGLVTATFFTYKSLRDMRSDLRDEVELMKKKASQDYAVLTSEMKLSVGNKIQDVERTVNNRIDSEFNKDNIQGLVKEKAQQRIDKIADLMIGQQVEKKITPKIDQVDAKIKNLNAITEFSITSTAAQYDDMSAFEQLRKWSNDKSYPFRARAEKVLNGIITAENTEFLTSGESYSYAKKADTDISKLNMNSLLARYRASHASDERNEIFEHVSKRSDITKREKIDFVVEILKKDNSLRIKRKAGLAFNGFTGQQLDPLQPKAILEWYDKNATKIIY